jgi:hypothetical protein
METFTSMTKKPDGRLRGAPLRDRVIWGLSPTLPAVGYNVADTVAFRPRHGAAVSLNAALHHEWLLRERQCADNDQSQRGGQQYDFPHDISLRH